MPLSHGTHFFHAHTGCLQHSLKGVIAPTQKMRKSPGHSPCSIPSKILDLGYIPLVACITLMGALLQVPPRIPLAFTGHTDECCKMYDTY